MGRDAAKACENQCFRCRKEAAKHNDKLGMLEYYKFRCEHSKRAEEMRRYRTIYDLYIAPEPKTQQQIADEEHVDLSTVFRDQKAGISKLSALIFGWLD